MLFFTLIKHPKALNSISHIMIIMMMTMMIGFAHFLDFVHLFSILVLVVSYCFQVLGGFDATHYVTERQWARALDGTLIPMSLVYRKDLVKLDGSDPLLLYGYGSYEVNKSSCLYELNCT